MKKAIAAIGAILFSILVHSTAPAAVRAVEITGDTPASAAADISAAGFNAVVLHFPKYRGPADPDVALCLEQWGAEANRLGLDIYVQVMTGPPLDAIADTKTISYRAAAADDGYPMEHKPAPASKAFWETAVFPKIDSLAALSAKLRIRGVFLGFTNHVPVSFDAETFGEFLKLKEPETDAAAIGAQQRKPYLIQKNLLSDYEKFQEDALKELLKGYFADLAKRAPGFEAHFATWEDTLPHRAAAAALSEAMPGPRMGLFELHYAKDAAMPAPAGFTRLSTLSVREFTPEEIEAMAGAAGLWNGGFTLSDAAPLWIPLDKVTVSEWPLGLTPDYMAAAAHLKSPAADTAAKYAEAADRLSDRVIKNHSGVPSIAYIFSGYNGYMYRDVFDILLASTGIKIDKFENSKLDKLAPKIGAYDVIVGGPAYNAVKSDKFLPYGKDLLDFVKNGGLLVLLDVTSAKQADWLGQTDPELKLVAEEKSGLSANWLNPELKMMSSPNEISKLPAGKVHFSETAPGWIAMAKDNENKPYAVTRLYGSGMIVAFAGFDIPPEMLINVWEYMLKMKDRFDVMPDIHSTPIGSGPNDVKLVAVTSGPESRFKVSARTLSQSRKMQSSELAVTLSKQGGARFAVPMDAPEAGLYRLTLTFHDEINGRVARRDSFTFMAPASFETMPEKSYYTGEKEAIVRVACMKTQGCGEFGATVSLKDSSGAEAAKGALKNEDKKSGAKYFSIPIAALKTGEYEIAAEIKQGGGKVESAAKLTKLPPGPAVETKLLNFRGGLAEVNGEPYFPIGIYSIPPENTEELGKSGVNAMIYYGNTTEAEAGANTAVEGKGIRFAAYPFYPHKRITGEDRGKLRAELVEKAKNKNMFMWYLADEPELFGQSPELIYEVYNFVKEVDPYRPQAVVMMDPNQYARYTHAADIFMFDRYPTPQSPIDTVGLYAQRAVQAVYGRKPVYAIPQAFSWEVWDGRFKEGMRHRPDFTEMRSSAIQSIVADVRGIIYWAFTASRYDMRKFPEHVKAFERLMTELSGLSDVLEEPNTFVDISVNPDFQGINWGTKIHDGTLYIFSYNGDTALRDKTTFTLPAEYVGASVEVYSEARSIPMQGSAFSDSFKPIESHIYIVRRSTLAK